MLAEVNEAKGFLIDKFGSIENVKPGIYAIPTQTSKGAAFMRVEILPDMGMKHFDLWKDEALTESWYENKGLHHWYSKGYNDEMHGSSTIESYNEQEKKAYQLGVDHAIIINTKTPIEEKEAKILKLIGSIDGSEKTCTCSGASTNITPRELCPVHSTKWEVVKDK